MDIKSPWHWTCEDCGGPIARLCAKGPCVEIHDFDRNGRKRLCGLEMNIPPAELKRLGVEDHEWNGGWVHTDPDGLCVCNHPKHPDYGPGEVGCDECLTDVGRVLGGWHRYTPIAEIQKDHEPAYWAGVAMGV